MNIIKKKEKFNMGNFLEVAKKSDQSTIFVETDLKNCKCYQFNDNCKINLDNDSDYNYLENLLNRINVIYEKAREKVLHEINNLDTKIKNMSEFESFQEAFNSKKRIGNFRNSGLKPINFTYGEVLFRDFCRILMIVFNSISTNDYKDSQDENQIENCNKSINAKKNNKNCDSTDSDINSTSDISIDINVNIKNYNEIDDSDSNINNNNNDNSNNNNSNNNNDNNDNNDYNDIDSNNDNDNDGNNDDDDDDSKNRNKNNNYNNNKKKERDILDNSKKLKFVDLGCGMGSCMAAATLLCGELQSSWKEENERIREEKEILTKGVEDQREKINNSIYLDEEIEREVEILEEVKEEGKAIRKENDDRKAIEKLSGKCKINETDNKLLGPHERIIKNNVSNILKREEKKSINTSLFERCTPQPPFFSHIIGIDLMRSKIKECKMLMNIIQESSSSSESMMKEEKKNENIYVFEEDFLKSFYPSEFEDPGWSDADVVYACATCFADDVLFPLVKLFRKLKRGAHVILIDKMVLSDSYNHNNNSNNDNNSNNNNNNNNNIIIII